MAITISSTSKPRIHKRNWLSGLGLLMVPILFAFTVLQRHLSNRSREQRLVLAVVEDLEGNALFDYEVSADGQPNGNKTAPGPSWLRDFLGEEMFRAIHTIRLGRPAEGLHVRDRFLIALQGQDRLHTLDLHEALIADDQCRLLSKLTQLRELHGFEISDRGAVALEAMQNLESISVCGKKPWIFMNRALESIAKLKGLTSVELSNLALDDSGVERLSALPRLRSLRILSFTQVHGEGLARLGALERLDLWSDRIDDCSLEIISKLGRLKELSLVGGKITDKGLKHLVGLPEVRSLQANTALIEDNELRTIAGLPKLQRLEVRHSRLTAESLETIKSMRSLDHVCFARDSLTEEVLEKLRAARSDLRVELK